MKLNLRCLPVGDLPYTDIKLTTRLTVKIFEACPFLAVMPNAAPGDSVLRRTLENLPGVTFQDNRIVFQPDNDEFRQQLLTLDYVYNNPSAEGFEQYKMAPYFWEKYEQILTRIKPVETVVNILGPFSLSQILSTEADFQLLEDRCYRKLVIHRQRLTRVFRSIEVAIVQLALASRMPPKPLSLGKREPRPFAL